MNICPVCSSPMLRHMGNQRIYWYCQSCHQEVPNLESMVKGAPMSRTRRNLQPVAR